MFSIWFLDLCLASSGLSFQFSSSLYEIEVHHFLNIFPLAVKRINWCIRVISRVLAPGRLSWFLFFAGGRFLFYVFGGAFLVVACCLYGCCFPSVFRIYRTLAFVIVSFVASFRAFCACLPLINFAVSKKKKKSFR